MNFNQKIKSYEETIAKQNKKLDNLFSKLYDDKINISKTNTPTKNNYEEKTVSEDLTKESKLKREKIAKKLDTQLTAIRKKYKEHYYKNHFSKIKLWKINSNNFPFTKENVKTINNGLDGSNLSETREKKSRKSKKNKEGNCFDCWRFHVKWCCGGQTVKNKTHTCSAHSGWKN